MQPYTVETEFEADQKITLLTFCWWLLEPPRDKTNKTTLRAADSDQNGHPPSLIRVFAVRSMGS